MEIYNSALLLHFSCSTSTAPPQLFHLSFSTSADPPPLIHLSWSTSADPPQLIHLSCSTSTALFQQFHLSCTTSADPPQLPHLRCSTSAPQLSHLDTDTLKFHYLHWFHALSLLHYTDQNKWPYTRYYTSITKSRRGVTVWLYHIYGNKSCSSHIYYLIWYNHRAIVRQLFGSVYDIIIFNAIELGQYPRMPTLSMDTLSILQKLSCNFMHKIFTSGIRGPDCRIIFTWNKLISHYWEWGFKQNFGNLLVN